MSPLGLPAPSAGTFTGQISVANEILIKVTKIELLLMNTAMSK